MKFYKNPFHENAKTVQCNQINFFCLGKKKIKNEAKFQTILLGVFDIPCVKWSGFDHGHEMWGLIATVLDPDTNKECFSL